MNPLYFSEQANFFTPQPRKAYGLLLPILGAGGRRTRDLHPNSIQIHTIDLSTENFDDAIGAATEILIPDSYLAICFLIDMLNKFTKAHIHPIKVYWDV